MLRSEVIKQGFYDSIRSLFDAAGFQVFRDSLDQDPVVSVRRNPSKEYRPSDGSPTPHEYIRLGDDSHRTDLTGVPWAQHGYYLDERPYFTHDPSFHAGGYYVQDASSQIIGSIIGQLKQDLSMDRVLDMCAAPGGKTTDMLSALGRASLIVANEFVFKRALILKENIIKWGYENVVVVNSDPQAFEKLPEYFDCILVDAPCSGEGLFRKDEEAIDQWSPEYVELCARRQKKILDSAWQTLKPGGVLLYSTCTYNRTECEDIVEWLIQEHGASNVPIDTEEYMTQGVVVGDVDGITTLRFFPHKLKGEGFFVAIMQKPQSNELALSRSSQSTRLPSNTSGRELVERGSRKSKERNLELTAVVLPLAPWLKNSDAFSQFIRGDDIFIFPKTYTEDLNALSQNIHVVYAGVHIAEKKRKTYVPAHPLAVSIILNQDAFPHLDLDKDQAITFLKKETLMLPTATGGMTLMTYHGLPLGFANILSDRVNNLYPKEWRILK